MKAQAIVCAFALSIMVANAQVDEIKKKSAENSSKKSEGGSGGSSTATNIAFFIDVFRIVGEAQTFKLQKADSVKRIVSLEAFFQGAVQPSSYYIFNPRIRGNWGLFSSDFRVNYLIEESHDSTRHDLTTLDWQILQLNIFTMRNFTGRIGGGNLYERFGSKQSFFEWTAGTSFFSNNQSIVANIEYRVAKDFTTNAVPRREINFSIEKQVFGTGSLRGYVTLGGVYQRYYQTVSVWGLQLGMAIRIF